MCGLKHIVDLRGGILEGFKYAAVIQRALVWYETATSSPVFPNKATRTNIDNRADFSYAYAAGTPLMFPFVPQLASSLSLHNRFQSRLMGGDSMNYLGVKGIVIRNQQLVEVFELLYSITECLGSFDYTDLANMSSERVQLSDSIYLAEWQLFQLEELSRNLEAVERTIHLPVGSRDSVEGGNGSSTVIDISDSLMFAGHLFMHMALRGQPPGAPRHRGIIEALMSSLCDTLLVLDILSDPEPYASPRSHYSTVSQGNRSVGSLTTTTSNTSVHSNPSTKLENCLINNALLWVLFVGSCVRMPTIPTMSHYSHQTVLFGDHHRFFLQALKSCCRMRCITDKETLATNLKDIVWLQSWCENQLDLIWAEIGDHLAP